MKIKASTFAFVAPFLVVLVLATLIWQWTRPRALQVSDVKIPPLSEFATRGKATFDKDCAPCHGANASGTESGPPLIHDYYNPGHHSDEAFLVAVKLGVRQHHWRFGDMPPQPQVTQGQIAAIIQYVRELQAANGIASRPHRM